VVDPKAIGYPLAAVVRVAPATRQLERIREIARETPEVVECHRITGEDCFFIKLHLRTIDDLERILDRFTPYGRTTTSLVHSSAVENRPLPMAAAD
jgi:Lrp/AsnC family leucine-responsive transcriptional regulator